MFLTGEANLWLILKLDYPTGKEKGEIGRVGGRENGVGAGRRREEER